VVVAAIAADRAYRELGDATPFLVLQFDHVHGAAFAGAFGNDEHAVV